MLAIAAVQFVTVNIKIDEETEPLNGATWVK